MSQLSRRDILKQGVLMATAGLGALGGQPAAWAIPPIGRTRPSHLKLSIAAYSYRDYLTSKPPMMNLFRYVDLAADMGLDAVEPTSCYFPPDVTTDYLHHLKQHALLLGLDISGTAISNNFCLPPGPKRDEQLTSTRLWIDRAAELDAPVTRIFAGSVPRGESEEQAVAWAIEGIKESLSYAARKGITLALENHGGITATPRQILKLVTAVNGPNFGVNLDTGNFHGDDPYAEIAELAPARFKSRLRLSGKVGFSRLLADLHCRLDANHGVRGSWLRFPVFSVRSWRTPLGLILWRPRPGRFSSEVRRKWTIRTLVEISEESRFF